MRLSRLTSMLFLCSSLIVFSGCTENTVLVPKSNVQIASTDAIPSHCTSIQTLHFTKNNQYMIGGEQFTLLGVAPDQNAELSPYIKNLSNANLCTTNDPYVPDSSLVYLYTEDGTFVNEQLIRIGLAKAYRDRQYTHKDYFTKLEDEAKFNGVGIWKDQKKNQTTNTIPKFIEANEARLHIGEQVFLRMVVASLGKTSRAAYFNALKNSKDNPDNVAGVILLPTSEEMQKIVYNAGDYYGQTVLLQGTLSLYKNQPQIILSAPTQIQILKK